jgi:hypothetical protein
MDYVIDQYKMRKLMIVEEKRFEAELANAQKQIIALMDHAFRQYLPTIGYEYWGFYLLQLDAEIPEQGSRLNGQILTVQDLIRHLNFERKFCEPMALPKPMTVRELDSFIEG